MPSERRNLQTSEEENTSYTVLLAPVKLQLIHGAEWQYQYAEINHALEDARDQPERVEVDAVPWVGVAVLPCPF